MTAATLQDQLNEKISEIHNLVAPISDEQASRTPAAGEWCVKEVLSHLSGDVQTGFVAGFKRFVEEETPVIDVVPGITFYEQRQGKSVRDLLSEVESQYKQIGQFVGGLSQEQLDRKANIPLLKETPIGEYPTLALWTTAMVNYHLAGHVTQLQQLCK
jgi:uncharacterized damage-inducible protein DinB